MNRLNIVLTVCIFVPMMAWGNCQEDLSGNGQSSSAGSQSRINFGKFKEAVIPSARLQGEYEIVITLETDISNNPMGLKIRALHSKVGFFVVDPAILMELVPDDVVERAIRKTGIVFQDGQIESKFESMGTVEVHDFNDVEANHEVNFYGPDLERTSRHISEKFTEILIQEIAHYNEPI